MSNNGMPGAGPSFWGWRTLFLLLAANFAASVAAIVAGDFDKVGLPARMLSMEIFTNGVEAVLWFSVAVLSLMKKPHVAAELVVFLAGFLWFDVLTTHRLVMPIPPGFLWWGSALVVLMLVAARKLVARRIYATDPNWLNNLGQPSLSPNAFRKTAWLFGAFGLSFAVTVMSLINGDYNRSGLPGSVLPWHMIANGLEALLCFLAAALIWAGSVRAAGWLGLFAVGMFAWDMLTTAFLMNMPIPWQPIWGPIALLLGLMVTSRLRKA